MKKWWMIKRWVPGTTQNPQGHWTYVISFFSTRLGRFINYTDDIEKGTTFLSVDQLIATLAGIIHDDPAFCAKLAAEGTFHFIQVQQKTVTKTFREEINEV